MVKQLDVSDLPEPFVAALETMIRTMREQTLATVHGRGGQSPAPGVAPRTGNGRSSLLDRPPVSVGGVLRPFPHPDDDLLDEMINGTSPGGDDDRR